MTTEAKSLVLNVLNSDTAHRLGGLTVSSLMTATGLSEGQVRAALAALIDSRDVRRSYHRSSRGYTHTSITQAERDEEAAKQALVNDLRAALGTLVGSATAVSVAGLIGGGINVRLTQRAAQTLLARLEG